MQTIIAATDFSLLANHAASYAADMAHALNMELLLMHSLPFPISTPEAPVSPEIYDTMLEDAGNELNKLKIKLANAHNDKLTIRTQVVTGNLLAEIKEQAKLVDLFTVVMGIQGSSASNRFLFGSNALAALHQLQLPLVIVPGMTKFKPMKKLALATDLYHASDIIPFEQVKNLIRLLGCTIDIVSVYRSGESVKPEMIPESKYLQMELADFNPNFHFVENKNVEEAIAAFTNENSIDMLIVVPGKYTLLDTLFHKSVSKQIALHIPIPIMALHNIHVPKAIK